MTFIQYLKVKKGMETDEKDLMELMDEYYDEYMEYLKGVKEGCGPGD
ncbi:MAG TPA: hypothetical protein VJM57_07780 [Thermodesulfobacteriota bacterium]|nr:hypothetical protein [Thermodesulfobacteriota bacterium]